MRRTLHWATVYGLSAAIFGLATIVGGTMMAGDVSYTPEYTNDGKLKQPSNFAWREWRFVGTPLTPNALNEGQAPFPEFHIVYIDPLSWAHFKKTGQFREGTVFAKELTGVRAPRGPTI